MSLRDRVRAFIEQHLPWYDHEYEMRRAERSRRILRLSRTARREARTERLASYQRVSARR